MYQVCCSGLLQCGVAVCCCSAVSQCVVAVRCRSVLSQCGVAVCCHSALSQCVVAVRCCGVCCNVALNVGVSGVAFRKAIRHSVHRGRRHPFAGAHNEGHFHGRQRCHDGQVNIRRLMCLSLCIFL